MSKKRGSKKLESSIIFASREATSTTFDYTHQHQEVTDSREREELHHDYDNCQVCVRQQQDMREGHY